MKIFLDGHAAAGLATRHGDARARDASRVLSAASIAVSPRPRSDLLIFADYIRHVFAHAIVVI